MKHRIKGVVAVFTAVLLFNMIFMARILFTRAVDAGQMDSDYKYYKNILLEYGMDLTDVAAVYADLEHYPSEQAYIREVMQINHFETTEDVHAGMYLVVPYYAEVKRIN